MNQIFIFNRLVDRPRDWIRFIVYAESEQAAGEKFQAYLDERPEMIGSKKPWGEFWFVTEPAKVSKDIFSLSF